MRRFIIMVLVGTFLIAANATPAMSAGSASLCEKAYNLRLSVIKQHGKRAPGRNICRFGVKHSTGNVVPATYGQKKRYMNQLKRLKSPYLSPVPPQQTPAGVMNAAVVGAPPESIAQCESGGDPTTNTGNGFYGKWQFTLETWQAMGGSGLPSNASEAEQDYRAAKLWAGGAGRGNWPVCGGGAT